MWASCSAQGPLLVKQLNSIAVSSSILIGLSVAFVDNQIGQLVYKAVTSEGHHYLRTCVLNDSVQCGYSRWSNCEGTLRVLCSYCDRNCCLT